MCRFNQSLRLFPEINQAREGGGRGSSPGNPFMSRYSSRYLNLLVFEGAYLCIDLGWSLDD